MRLFVETAGDSAATPLMLLHGVGESHKTWNPQVASLSRHFRLFLPDLPGYGRSPGPFNLDAAVESLHALHQGRPLHLCGLSAGAMVALRWAARYPEDVASLIISAVHVRPPRLVMWLQTAVMRLIPAGAFGGDEDGVTKTTVLQAMGDLRRADLRPDLARVRVPTLVMCGGKDGLNLAASRVAAAGITGAELRIVPGAKHLWNQDLPDLFNRTLVEWVGRSSAEAQ